MCALQETLRDKNNEMNKINIRVLILMLNWGFSKYRPDTYAKYRRAVPILSVHK